LEDALRQRGETVLASDKVGGDTGLKAQLLELLGRQGNSK